MEQWRPSNKHPSIRYRQTAIAIRPAELLRPCFSGNRPSNLPSFPRKLIDKRRSDCLGHSLHKLIFFVNDNRYESRVSN